MPEQSPGPAVSFAGVTKRYGDGAAVDGVTLDIAGGSFVALVGTSGSGKSTLLKTVNRLVVPDAGRVAIDGRDVADEPPARLRRRIGYVFQNVDPARVAAMLDLVELPRAFAGRMPAELSGGQRQRVGVARALAAEARLLLMDEPFGALDPVTREALAGAIRRLHADLSLTTIMVTHDMAEALLNAPAAMLAGEAGDAADALVAVPRAQAERLTAMTR